MIFPPKCMTREVKSPRSSKKGDFFTIFATEYHYDYEFQENIAAHRAAAHRRPGAQNLDQDWFQLRFIENNGAAFGMHIASRGGFDWGKLLLGVFRIVMVGFIGWLMHHLCTKRQDTPKGVIVGLALIFAGAMGNSGGTTPGL